MNKETLLNLIDKEMKELKLLLDGFIEMDRIPPAIIKLAASKVDNVIVSLSSVKEYENTSLTPFNVDAAYHEPVEIHVEERVAAPLYAHQTADDDNVEVEFIYDEEDLEENLLAECDTDNVQKDATAENLLDEADDVEVELIYDEEQEEESEELQEPLDEEQIEDLEPTLEEEQEPILSADVELEEISSDEEELQVVYNSDEEEELEEEQEEEQEELIQEEIAQEEVLDVELQEEPTQDEEEESEETFQQESTLEPALETIQPKESKSIVESIPSSDSIYDKIQKAKDDSISATISKQKLTNLGQGISIADRFRYQRELFTGNGELMNKTLGDLNECGDLASAMAYVETKFKWDFDNVNVKDFINLLERRFIE